MIKLRMARCYRNPDWDEQRTVRERERERATCTYTCNHFATRTLYVFLFPRGSRSFLATWIRIVSVSRGKETLLKLRQSFGGTGSALPNYARASSGRWLKPVYTVLGLSCSARGNGGCTNARLVFPRRKLSWNEEGETRVPTDPSRIQSCQILGKLVGECLGLIRLFVQ